MTNTRGVENGTQMVDALTSISGPSAEKLRQQKSLDQIAAELRRQQYEAVEAALADGHARSGQQHQQNAHVGKFAPQEK